MKLEFSFRHTGERRDSSCFAASKHVIGPLRGSAAADAQHKGPTNPCLEVKLCSNKQLV